MIPSGELRIGCRRAFFAAIKAEVGNRGYMILYEFADYNPPLEVRGSAKDYLYIPSSFPKENLEQLQQFVQGTF